MGQHGNAQGHSSPSRARAARQGLARRTQSGRILTHSSLSSSPTNSHRTNPFTCCHHYLTPSIQYYYHTRLSSSSSLSPTNPEHNNLSQPSSIQHYRHSTILFLRSNIIVINEQSHLRDTWSNLVQRSIGIAKCIVRRCSGSIHQVTLY